MFFQHLRTFVTILNSDALVFLSTRIAGVVLSITSVVLLCRAVTIQHLFDTDGKGLIYDLMPLGPLAYSMVWSIVSVILPGCQRKYHPGLDMGFDFFGWAISFGAGGALLAWSFQDGYEVDFCLSDSLSECEKAVRSLSSTEKSGAILLLLTGLTHLVMFVRATMAVLARRKKYVPSRNSFMRLEKGSGTNSTDTSQMQLHTTNFVEAADKRRKQGQAIAEPERPVATEEMHI